MEVQNLEFGGVISDFPVSLQIPPLLAEPSPPFHPGAATLTQSKRVLEPLLSAWLEKEKQKPPLLPPERNPPPPPAHLWPGLGTGLQIRMGHRPACRSFWLSKPRPQDVALVTESSPFWTESPFS